MVLETVGFNATELSSYRRERGLFAEQVNSWRQTAQYANAVLTMAEQKKLQRKEKTYQWVLSFVDCCCGSNL